MHRRSSKVFKPRFGLVAMIGNLRFGFVIMIGIMASARPGPLVDLSSSHILEPCNPVQICVRSALVDPNAAWALEYA